MDSVPPVPPLPLAEELVAVALPVAVAVLIAPPPPIAVPLVELRSPSRSSRHDASEAAEPTSTTRSLAEARMAKSVSAVTGWAASSHADAHHPHPDRDPGYAGGDSCDSAARRQRMAMRTAT